MEENSAPSCLARFGPINSSKRKITLFIKQKKVLCLPILDYGWESETCLCGVLFVFPWIKAIFFILLTEVIYFHYRKSPKHDKAHKMK